MLLAIFFVTCAILISTEAQQIDGKNNNTSLLDAAPQPKRVPFNKQQKKSPRSLTEKINALSRDYHLKTTTLLSIYVRLNQNKPTTTELRKETDVDVCEMSKHAKNDKQVLKELRRNLNKAIRDADGNKKKCSKKQQQQKDSSHCISCCKKWRIFRKDFCPSCTCSKRDELKGNKNKRKNKRINKNKGKKNDKMVGNMNTRKSTPNLASINTGNNITSYDVVHEGT